MKRRFFSMIFLVITMFLSGVYPQDALAGAGLNKQEGISYVSWLPDQYSQPDADSSLAAIRATGANWISLVVTQYQDTISTVTISATSATPTDADLIHVINQAHKLGLKVMLKPHVDLASDPSHWRGQIGTDYSEEQWLAWFASYQTFINHYAQVSQANGADQFCVGTELSGTQNREAQWRAVITAVRSRYSGPIVYAANWGDETVLTWWDAVDFIGVDAYYPIVNKSNPTVAELKAGWSPFTAQLSDLATKWHKSILFTEIGYRSQDGAAQHPWDYQVGGALDLQEQADAYQATIESVFEQPWFAGMYWWSWGTNPLEGGPCDDGYSPHDKPAEDILRAWYGGLPRPAQALPPQDINRAASIYTDTLGDGWQNWSWSSTVDQSSTSPVYQGQQAISVTAQAWGALSLHYDNFDTTPYQWLEFYIYEGTDNQPIDVFFNNQNDHELINVSLNRFTPTCSIPAGAWTRVLIPLVNIQAANRQIQRVSLKNYSAQQTQFSVDEMRLISIEWLKFLPLLTR